MLSKLSFLGCGWGDRASWLGWVLTLLSELATARNLKWCIGVRRYHQSEVQTAALANVFACCALGQITFCLEVALRTATDGTFGRTRETVFTVAILTRVT